MTPAEMAAQLNRLLGMLERQAVTFKTLDYRQQTTVDADSAGRDVTTITIVIVHQTPDVRSEP